MNKKSQIWKLKKMDSKQNRGKKYFEDGMRKMKTVKHELKQQQV